MLQELAFFLSIQKALNESSILVYYNPKKIFQIDLDIFKKFGFRAITFLTVSDKAILEKCQPFANIIQPILFFSRLFAPIERNYQPRKLEIASFVWVVKNIRYIIESFKSNIIIQTDHSMPINILQQSSIIFTTLTIRFNLKLVQASQFL